LLQKTNPYSAYLKFHAYEYFETLIHVWAQHLYCQ
jgi:hypothetical protein